MTAASPHTAFGRGAPVEQPTTVTLFDARSDVYRARGPEHEAVVPGNHRADIARVRVRHNNRVVVVRTKFVRLRREGLIQSVTRLRTSEETKRLVTLSAYKPYWRGRVEVRHGSNIIDPCASSRNIDYADDLMTVRIARSCLGEPRWVRANVIALFRNPDRSSVLRDSAHTDSFRLTGSTRRLYRSDP